MTGGDDIAENKNRASGYNAETGTAGEALTDEASGSHGATEGSGEGVEAFTQRPEEKPGGPRTASSGSLKASTLNRSIARFIDVLIVLLLARLPDYIGVFAGLTYVGIADGLAGGRSLGKRIIGLRVVYQDKGRQADMRASILRNSTLCLLYIVSLIPLVGWILACLGLCFEFLLVIGSPFGKRLGDEVAGTIVLDEPQD